MCAARRAHVEYADLREYLSLLESKGALQAVKAPVELRHELGAIAARGLEVGAPALRFDNIVGYEGSSLVVNIMYSHEQVGEIFNVAPNADAVGARLDEGIRNRTPSEVVSSGPCKEVIDLGESVDLYKFPTPVWHELDAGPYIATTAGVITKDRDSGVHNMGTYRMMIKDRRTLTLTAGGGSGGSSGSGTNYGGKGDAGGADHLLSYERVGEPAPIAVALGMDPLLTLASGTAIPADENGMGEYEAAGSWRGAPTRLVKCETSDLMVPADAEIILEGVLHPGARTHDGPHGESTGFYGETPAAFQIEVICISHRRDPISYGLICQREQDYPRTLLRSASIKSVLRDKGGLTSIKDLRFPEVGRNGMLLVSADIDDTDEPRRIMEAVWNQMRFRWVIVVDADCDLDDWLDVMWRVVSAVIPDRDVIRGKEFPSLAQGAAMEFIPPSYGLGIDATMNLKDDPQFVAHSRVSPELMEHVKQRWNELMTPTALGAT